MKKVKFMNNKEIESNTVKICQRRLVLTTKEFYSQDYDEQQWERLLPIIEYVVDTNILCGDALSLTNPNDGKPIVFAEWSFLSAYKVKRRDFVYEQLINQADDAEVVVSDRNTEGFIPKPIRLPIIVAPHRPAALIHTFVISFYVFVCKDTPFS